MSKEWRERKRPNCLEKRYGFSDYEALRDFLDRAAELSEREGLYPDMGFGRDYVNITINAAEGADELAIEQRDFAVQLDALYTANASP
ncbi:MAG: 4a-hydroxytetrahydrobiopterin dehydratase [Gammaproteobacteria bacterium]|nr:4a-hydroxytetrahydrobiopterin dehydratase [Gammaproteobacteria bacterium]